MGNDLVVRIKLAVMQGMAERKNYFEAIGLPDEQMLGRPAAESDLVTLETRLGRSLPPSYRTFLGLFDGWKMIDGGVDLLPVQDLLGGVNHINIESWRQQMKVTGEDVAARSLVIGISGITPTKYLLDPEVVDEDGEWRLVQHHKIEEAEFPTFLVWLEESVDEYRKLARMTRDGTIDEDDDDFANE